MNKKRNINIFSSIMFAILIIYSLTMILLMLWVAMSALKSKTDFNFNPLAFPKKINFKNFFNVFKDLYVPVTVIGVGQKKMFLMQLFFNSFVYSLGCTFVHMFFKSMSAYVVSRYKFKLASLIYSLNIIVMILPVVGRLPSELQLMRTLGLYDNLLALCLMKGSFAGMDFLLLHATFSSIPKDYSDAALIDGASHFKIMLNIIFPMAIQIILILSLTNFIAYWNDWNVNIVYLPSYPTAAYALYVFQNSNLQSISVGGIPYILCACTVVMIPILVVFIFFRNQLMGEINFEGVKG